MIPCIGRFATDDYVLATGRKAKRRDGAVKPELRVRPELFIEASTFFEMASFLKNRNNMSATATIQNETFQNLLNELNIPARAFCQCAGISGRQNHGLLRI